MCNHYHNFRLSSSLQKETQMYISVATTENSRRFLKKLKIELLYDPAILLPGIYLE